MFKEKEEESMSKSTITVDEETNKNSTKPMSNHGTNRDKIII